MRKKFAVLTVMGALLGLIAPASSMAAYVYPASHKFEISGAGMPAISGAMAGTCTLTKIAGTIPPISEDKGSPFVFIGLERPTATCTGASIEFATGTWQLRAASGTTSRVPQIITPVSPFTMRYASLPGCKLVAYTTNWGGIWSNGSSDFEGHIPSGYHGEATISAIWNNDGAACALAGKSEPLTYRSAGEANAVDLFNSELSIELKS